MDNHDDYGNWLDDVVVVLQGNPYSMSEGGAYDAVQAHQDAFRGLHSEGYSPREAAYRWQHASR